MQSRAALQPSCRMEQAFAIKQKLSFWHQQFSGAISEVACESLTTNTPYHSIQRGYCIKISIQLSPLTLLVLYKGLWSDYSHHRRHCGITA